MKKQHILYDAISETLKHIADSQATDTFSSSPEAVAQGDRYARLTSALRNWNVGIAQAKAARSLETPFADILQGFEEFSTYFPSYPSLNRPKFSLLLTVAERIATEGVAIDDKDIDENAFTLILLPDGVEQIFYSHANSSNLLDSVVTFAASDVACLRKELIEDHVPVSLELLYHLMLQVARHGFAQVGTFTMLRKQAPEISAASAYAFTRLSIVADGKRVHRPVVYSNKPNVARRDSLSPTIDYQQHGEVIEVLSEYNTRDDILSKYLTLYHVFENFMCKAPIVELQTQHKGRQISIRDFRSLSTHLLGKELDALERLFKRIVDEKPDGVVEFQKDVFARWTAYLTAIGAADADKVLAGLNLKNDANTLKATDLNVQNIGRYFVKIVYQLRNAVVHNKEVDVHVTAASMGNGLERLIADVAIPSLERLCFHLLSSKNDYVWYDDPHLLLHK